MPTGITLNVGAGGASLGVDSDGTFDYEIVKIGYSVAGATPVQVSATNPLPTVLTGANSVSVSNFPATQPVSIAATLGTNLLQAASTALGTPQAFGTVPTGVVLGVSADAYIAGTRARSNQTTTAAGVLDVNLVGALGVTLSVTNGLFTEITDGTTKVAVIAATTALKTDLSSVAGTATVAAAAGVQKVGISGNAGAALDAVITAATAPANGLAQLVVNATTPPSLTTGQSIAQQCDYQGNTYVQPYRRSNVKAATGSIASITAATMLPAQAAGIFADLATLDIAIGAVATTSDAIITVNISDGTATYKFPLNTGAITTVGNVDVDKHTVTFSPPIPATSAATAWTIALSLAQTTVFYTATFVLQKAS